MSSPMEERYDIDRRKAYLRIEDDDAARMKAMKPIASEILAGATAAFYDHLAAFSETSEHLQSAEHIKNLKARQSAYFLELMDGVYDAEYMDKRLVIGRVHERIGLEPQWYIGAYALYLNTVMGQLFERQGDDPKLLLSNVQSLIKVIFMDMGFAIDTYIEAMMDHEQSLKATFTEALTEYSGGLNQTTSEIVAASSELSASATEQAATVAEVTATVSEVKQTSAQSIAAATSVISTSEDAFEASQRGTTAVEDSLAAMRDIQGQVEAIADKILHLSERTQQIGEIIKSVNEISEQSKLLALNAAIEAARAGDHGRGFSVVASEIRSLADQSKQATEQVGRILGEIQQATNSAVIATEEGSKRVDSGVELASRAGENIHTLTQAIRTAADAARLISSTTQQQNVGVEEVAEAMLGINAATAQTAAGLQETESAARKLAEMAVTMDQLIDRFSAQEEREVTYRLT